MVNFSNVGQLTGDQYFHSESDTGSNVLEDRKTDSGESAESRETGNFELWPVWIRLPIDEKKNTLSITILKIGDYLIADPSVDEEKVYDSRLTVATLADGTLCGMQKGGDAPLTEEEIMKMVELAIEKGKELRKAFIGRKKMEQEFSKYEKARMLGSRALQISMGAPF